MKKHLLVLGFLCLSGLAAAQEWMQIYRTFEEAAWTLPIQIDKLKEVDVDVEKGQLTPLVRLEDGSTFVVPFSLVALDSIRFVRALTDAEKGHNRYRPFAMYITTEGETDIVEREVWQRCHIAIDGRGEYSNFSGTGQIRGRGNSSWLWYDKKPYKFKLDSKSKLLGLEKAKNWNLLANYRDVTDLMNTLAFETARRMGMPYTNHTRYVEVFLNQRYIGLYQLTEKIEIKQNRIDIPEAGSTLLTFDQDDGPGLSPYDSDNFYSKVFQLPLCVKTPEELTPGQLDSIREDFARAEMAVKRHSYSLADSLMDLSSFIGILQLHELFYNVEIDAPRSIYMFKPKGGKYTFGPVWDWDAGFDFDWANMETNHTFFSDYRELIYGTDPMHGTGAAYHINMFWRQLFADARFVSRYKAAWAALGDSIVQHAWAETCKYADALRTEGAYDRDSKTWPLQKTTGSWWSPSVKPFRPDEEIAKMQQWLMNRKAYLDDVIANYPDGQEEVVFTVLDTIRKTQTVSYEAGYTQSGTISINRSEILSILGGVPTSLVPLDAGGFEGSRTVDGSYGAWFDDEGNTCDSYDGHVYIESNKLYSWNYGCHPDNCWYDETHTVTMQFRRGDKAVNVEVTFVVE